MARPTGLNPPDRRFQQRAARRCRSRRSTDDEATPPVWLQPADRQPAARAGQPEDVHEGFAGRPRRGRPELFVALDLGPPHGGRPLPAGVLERADVGGGALPRPDARNVRDGRTPIVTRRSSRRWSPAFSTSAPVASSSGTEPAGPRTSITPTATSSHRPGSGSRSLTTAIRVIKALWTESPATYDGPYFQVKDAYCEPRPTRSRR